MFLPSTTHNIVLDQEGQIRHDLLHLSRYLFYPVESYITVFNNHIRGFHIGNRIPVRFVERYSRQDGFPPVSNFALHL